MVGVQHLTRCVDVGRIAGLGIPGQLKDGVEPGANPARFGALIARSFELADLAQGSLANLIGQLRLLDTCSVVLSAVRLILAQLLTDCVQLLPKQELALALLHPLANIVSDLVIDFGLGDVRLSPLDQGRQPCHDVGGLQQLPLPFVAQPGRVSGQIGKGRRIGDAVDRIDDLPGVAPLQRRNDKSLVLGRELLNLIGIVRCFGEFLSLNPKRGTRSGNSGADLDSPLSLDHRSRLASG